MDPRLAEIYGTNEDVSDVEKTAAAELAEKLASENETNIDGMSDEEIEALAQEVLSADEKTEDVKEEESTEETEPSEKVAEDKVAEADYLGRVMAHAYVHELKEIDKTASAEKTAGKHGKVMGKMKSMKMKHAAEDKKEEKKEEKEEKKEEKGEKKLPPFMKKSSALDTLAIERAKELLVENGFEQVAEEETEEPAEKTEKKASSKADILSQAVEARAVEILKAEGYEFEE